MPIPARGRRRSCPCCQLTLSVTGTSQPAQVYDAHGRLAFRYQRARFGHIRFAKALVPSQPFRFAMTYRAGRRGKMVAICKDPRHCDPRVETLRSASVGQPSRQPVSPLPFHRLSRRLLSSFGLPLRGGQSDGELSLRSGDGFFRAASEVPAGVLSACSWLLKNL